MRSGKQRRHPPAKQRPGARGRIDRANRHGITPHAACPRNRSGSRMRAAALYLCVITHIPPPWTRRVNHRASSGLLQAVVARPWSRGGPRDQRNSALRIPPPTLRSSQVCLRRLCFAPHHVQFRSIRGGSPSVMSHQGARIQSAPIHFTHPHGRPLSRRPHEPVSRESAACSAAGSRAVSPMKTRPR